MHRLTRSSWASVLLTLCLCVKTFASVPGFSKAPDTVQRAAAFAAKLAEAVKSS